MRYDYSAILESLKLYDDEPDYESNLFEFDKYKEQMINVIDNVLKIDKPFAICLNGEWGSGKTSLMRRVYEEFEERSKKDQKLKVIWFDAWKYERLDPVLALMQMIESIYKDKDKDKDKNWTKFKDVRTWLQISKYATLSINSFLPTLFVNPIINQVFDELIKRFGERSSEAIKYIETMDEILENVIGKTELLVWNDVSNGSSIPNMLKEYLKSYNIDWLENAKLNRNRDKISISNDSNSITIKLESNEKAIMKINGKTIELLVERDENGRIHICKLNSLLVFIDDLDRCHIDNIIGMLEAIKILFNAKNAKFIVAVDIKKLERAWALKHNNDANAIEEGKEHLDKIFPLRLNLPNKSKKEIDAYIDRLVGRFPEDLRDIVRVGCKANPRKIKRLMNILYVILTSLDDSDKSRFNEIFPCIVIWTIIATNFTNLANIVRNVPNTFIRSLSMPFNYLELKSRVERYKADMTRPRNEIEYDPGEWNFIPIWEEALKDTTLLNFDEILWKYIRYYTFVRSLVKSPDDNIRKIINGDIENVNTQLNDRLNNDDLRKQFDSMYQRYSMQLADNLQYVINNTKLFL